MHTTQRIHKSHQHKALREKKKKREKKKREPKTKTGCYLSNEVIFGEQRHAHKQQRTAFCEGTDFEDIIIPVFGGIDHYTHVRERERESER